MSIENFTLTPSDPESIEHFPSKISDDLADSIARSFERLEEHIDATEARLASRLANIEARIANKQSESL